MDDGDDLASSVVKLATLVSAHVPLEETLSRIAIYCSAAVRHAFGATVTLRDERQRVTVASDPLLLTVESLQESLGEGPSLTAAAERRIVSSESLDSDPSWPQFGVAVVGMGLHSALAVPMVVADQVIGTLSVYASEKGVFDARAARDAERYAEPAAAVAHNASVLNESQAQIAQLTEAMKSRSVVDQAIGVLRSRTGLSTDEALDRLRRVSNTEHVKLVEVARRIVEVAAIRAAKRRSQ
jgi:transcriptional regulator with GAF, ATPase, and Fis domain